jgi:Mg2+ and Co2+ transporter CorA
MCGPILEMICGEWLTICQYINTRLVQIEWELENPDYRNDLDGLGSALTKLHVWRRGVPLYQTSVAEATEILFSGEAQVKTPGQPIKRLQRDFEDIHHRLASLEHRIEDIMNVATAIASIEETRRAYRQGQYLGRLSWLAVIFAPMSFVSSFFSMTTDVTMLKTTYYIYFCVAVPFSLLALLLVNIDIIKKWAFKVRGRAT